MLVIVRSSSSTCTLHMLGYDVTRSIPDGAFLLAVHPDTNLPKADLPDNVPPGVAFVCCILMPIDFSTTLCIISIDNCSQIGKC